jgi:hypothetical protein
MNLNETGCEGVDWIHDKLRWRPLVNEQMDVGLRHCTPWSQLIRCTLSTICMALLCQPITLGSTSVCR